MATLNFKGKSAVWNHHLSVPYHTLEKDAGKSLKGADDAENLIIQGDNLLALKALLPEYQGRIKCIYIDPPYNTGNEGWVYSDSVSSPTIKEWVGKVVGKEGDDLTRHDKWLCMMTPRLKILRELLTADGAIFISIDDNELSNLKKLMDDVFSESNFVAQITVLTNPKGRSQDKYFATNHEYLLVYSRNVLPKGVFAVQKEAEQIINEYPEEDELGKYRLLELRNTHREFGRHNRKNLFYPFYVDTHNGEISLEKNNGGVEVLPIWEDGFEGCWAWGKPKSERELAFLATKKIGANWKIYRKAYASGAEKMLKTIFDDKSFHTEKGQATLNDLFETKTKIFPSPKSVDLIKTLLSTITDGNSLILDSFGGSGTTAHAVLDLNKEDGGNRKFILVEMEDYANTITAERVRRAAKKFGYKAGFTYHTLGQAIDAESLLSGKLPTYKEFAKYVFYLATGKNHPDDKKIKEPDAFAGKGDNESIYLLYKPDMEALKSLAITLDWAQATHEKDKGRKIVYAPACYLDDEMLDQFNIKFVSIPYNLFER